MGGMRELNRRVVLAMVCVCSAAATPIAAQTADFSRTPQPDAAVAEKALAPASFSHLFDVDDAQQQPAGPIPTPRHTGFKAMAKGLVSDVKHLPAKENLFWVGVGSALALAAHPLDDNANRKFVGSTAARHFFKAGAVLGQSPTLLAAAGAVYAFGRTKDEPKVSHMGMDLLRALAVSQGLVQVMKYSGRRERPDLSDHKSFPSGHAADTFAFATALERHFGWRFAAPAYLFSSYVAISRVPANRHWLSDAVFGASVGIIAGRTVTGHELNQFPVSVSYVPGGAMVMFVRRH
jgi:membrane-associated phospholipid phosphatase